MKYVYTITTEDYMPQFEDYRGKGIVEFVFTSEKQAQKQMDAIVELVNQDKWYVNPGHYIEFDTLVKDSTFGIFRCIKVEHPNGTHTIYTLQKRELNACYGI